MKINSEKASKDAERKERNALLKEMQSYPLDIKVALTKQRIREFVREHDAYFSFSGGKDSEALVHIGAIALKEMGYRKMDVAYISAGLDYLAVKKFVKKFCSYVEQNIDIEVKLHELIPKETFFQVLIREGYPLISKEVSQRIREARIGLKKADGTYTVQINKLKGVHRNPDGSLSSYNMSKYEFLVNSPFRISDRCCHVMKKKPAKVFEDQTGMAPVTGTMAQESRNRRTSWLIHGCNIFDGTRPRSNPMSFWLENDVLEYLYKNELAIAAPYGAIAARSEVWGQMDILSFIGSYSGCQYCTTGCNRTGCIFCLFGITQDRERLLRLQKIEPKRADYVIGGGTFGEDGLWKPDQSGLGYWFILDYLKKYGGIDIPYK